MFRICKHCGKSSMATTMTVGDICFECENEQIKAENERLKTDKVRLVEIIDDIVMHMPTTGEVGDWREEYEWEGTG